MTTITEKLASGSIVSLSETEHVLALIWSEVLRQNALPSASDDFFELGGDSMTMVLVESRVKEEFSVELPAGAMLGVSTLRGLSNLIKTRYDLLVGTSPDSIGSSAK